MPGHRPQTAQTQLPHPQGTRRGGASSLHEPIVRPRPTSADARRPAPRRALPPRPRGRPGKTKRPHRIPPAGTTPHNHHVAGPITNQRVEDQDKHGRPRAHPPPSASTAPVKRSALGPPGRLQVTDAAAGARSQLSGRDPPGRANNNQPPPLRGLTRADCTDRRPRTPRCCCALRSIARASAASCRRPTPSPTRAASPIVSELSSRISRTDARRVALCRRPSSSAVGDPPGPGDQHLEPRPAVLLRRVERKRPARPAAGSSLPLVVLNDSEPVSLDRGRSAKIATAQRCLLVEPASGSSGD
jgi:hypothetical protein